ncbi:U32 family peptidase [Pseudonocardia sp. CA-107938]|uniref:U32 family peptidase n=1 Tax=Pseudonocardia sp. CA-107938 TaxID=3240021 RepID=UPI003D89C005
MSELLAKHGLPRTGTGLPESPLRFADGAQYRVEIPSVEGPATMAAVLDEAARRGVHVDRISQGSGVLLLTDDELDRTAELGAEHGMEVSLFARPLAGWGTGSTHLTPSGAPVGAQARGSEQLAAVLADVQRAADHGIRSVLLTDVGVLDIANRMRRDGDLPAGMVFKASVQMGLANPASIRVAASLGADTYNVPTDLTLPQLADIRAAVDIPLDIYIESPDDLGGYLRYHEIAEIVRVCAPVYLKFGLRNAPALYPSGTHLEALSCQLARERVRRAEIGLAHLRRELPDARPSTAPAPDLAVPAPA